MKFNDNIFIRYFMFSHEHFLKMQELEKKAGNRNFQLGNVLVSGTFKKYTYMTRDPESYSKRYPDAKIVQSGDMRKLRFTEYE